jgi:hypothetical protein
VQENKKDEAKKALAKVFTVADKNSENKIHKEDKGKTESNPAPPRC